MKINSFLPNLAPRIGVAICLILVSLTSAGIAADIAGIEKALRKLDAEWSAAAGAKDVDKTVSYYSDRAVVLPPNAPMATTKEAIRAQWKGDLDNMVSGGWTPTHIKVTKSGEMAYVSGTYEWIGKDAGGKEVKDRGKYLEVWEKQADGTWKCSADCWNSDLPAAAGKP